jgi:hypothetical protein
MRPAFKCLGVALSIFLYFCLLSRIDFIVHGDLYHYGLRFSYEWANEYWITYFAAYAYFSIVIGFIYWLASNRTKKDLRISIGLAATVNLLLIGGLADIIFFSLWAKGLPPDNVVWWWTPWHRILGVWTSSMQIALMVLMSLAVVFMWVRILSFSSFVAKQAAIETFERSIKETIDP